MKSKTKFALWALPFLVLSLALGWAKWKADNPTPTKLDLEVRARFLRTDPLFFDSSLLASFYYLSRKEREDIDKHLWILPGSKIPIGMVTLRDPFIRWQTSSRTEFIHIGKIMQDDFYQDPLSGFAYRIHPATSHFIREWMTNHVEVEKLHLK